MLAEFEYQLSKEEYANGLRVAASALAAQDRSRMAWCLAQLAVVGVAIWIAITLHLGSFDGIILTLGLIGLPLLFMQTALVRRWRGLTFEPAAANLRLTFDTQGLVQRHDRAELRWSWNGIRGVYDVPGAVVLQVSGWHVITLPNRLWSEPSERVEFIQMVRNRATDLLPDFAPQVRTPFTLINVGAGFGGADLWLLQITAFVSLTEQGWPFAIEINSQTLAVIFALALAVSVGFFFVIRRGLRWLARMHRHAAMFGAHLLIWPVPVALLIYELVH